MGQKLETYLDSSINSIMIYRNEDNDYKYLWMLPKYQWGKRSSMTDVFLEYGYECIIHSTTSTAN